MKTIRRTTSCIAAMLLTSGLTVAAPQAVESYAGEIVMNASGELAAPWTERQFCKGTPRVCRNAVMNPETLEVARMDATWSTDFAATGNGSEVHRAETAIARAIRLKGPPTKR